MKLLNRLFRRAAPDIDEAQWQQAVQGMPFLHRLDADELARLKSLAARFLDTHAVSGANGFAVGNEVALCIAAQACLPVLNLTLELYVVDGDDQDRVG